MQQTSITIDEALRLYREGQVTIGRAAELAGIPEAEMIRSARAGGMRPQATPEMVAEELGEQP